MHLPEKLTPEQEAVLAKVSDAFAGHGWREKKIIEWWQTQMRNLNGYRPIEALAADKIDLVWMVYDKTMRKFDFHKEKVTVKIDE